MYSCWIFERSPIKVLSCSSGPSTIPFLIPNVSLATSPPMIDTSACFTHERYGWWAIVWLSTRSPWDTQITPKRFRFRFKSINTRNEIVGWKLWLIAQNLKINLSSGHAIALWKKRCWINQKRLMFKHVSFGVYFKVLESSNWYEIWPSLGKVTSTVHTKM